MAEPVPASWPEFDAGDIISFDKSYSLTEGIVFRPKNNRDEFGVVGKKHCWQGLRDDLKNIKKIGTCSQMPEEEISITEAYAIADKHYEPLGVGDVVNVTNPEALMVLKRPY